MTAGLVAIGELASVTGVAVSALRHYDELGVVIPAERIGGKRYFTTDTIGRVNFVRRAQQFGFTLVEIRDMLDESTDRARELGARKIEELRARQAELATMIELLEEVMTCGCEAVANCPSVTAPA